MRVFVTAAFGVALPSWVAGTAFAAPSPFLLTQRAVPPSIGLPFSTISSRLSPQAKQPGVLYSFGTGADGAGPQAGLVDMKGVLYGTTEGGGKYSEGTVFAVTAAGTERVLHSFGGSGTDGYYPSSSGLVDVSGVLYGTTADGGRYGCGTVFAITTAGTERVLYSFCDAKQDGEFPSSGLTAVNGVLYGETQSGGKHLAGTVFAVTTAGTERVVHSFGGTDGAYPYSGLTDVDGVLYGTTSFGGKYTGTAFSMTVAGSERVIYNFDNYDFPSGLIDVNGVLYGTTQHGGNGNGNVFAITAAGAERVLHNFGNGIDGVVPQAGLIYVNGVLYGTTFAGGRYGAGTVYAVTPAGSERVVRDFGFCDHPLADLIDVSGVLYGTTEQGGTYRRGTIFYVSP